MSRKIPKRDEIEVYRSDAGYICIRQGDGNELLDQEDSIVALDPSQVPTVIGWLKELNAGADYSTLGSKPIEHNFASLWEKFLGAKHQNDWLENLSNRSESELDEEASDFAYKLLLREVVNREAILIIELAATQYDQCERIYNGRKGDRPVLNKGELDKLTSCLVGSTLLKLDWIHSFHELPPERLQTVIRGIMQICAAMEWDFTLEMYQERLSTLVLLLHGSYGPWLVNLPDRLSFSDFLAQVMKNEVANCRLEASPTTGDDVH